MSKITGEDKDRFAKLIEGAFSQKEIDLFLKTAFDHGLSYYSEDGTDLERYFETCDKFHRLEGDDGFFKLVSAVAEARKGRREIQEYHRHICARLEYESRDVSAEEKSSTIDEIPGKSDLERTVDDTKGDREPMALADWLSHAVRRVCLLKIKDKPVGTGFLVGCDLVLTAYHNISPIVEQKTYRAEDVRLTFGYAYEKDEITLQKASTYSLPARDWLVAHSPSEPSEMDRHRRALEDPPLEHLDYALLQLDGLPGNDTIGDSPIGWFSIAEPVRLPKVRANLYILHHPDGVPLKYAEGNEVIRVSKSGSRVDYKTNTRGGSSGAPCFDRDHAPIALHVYGEADSTASVRDGFNRGIPLATIVNDLKRTGHFQFINQPAPYAGSPARMEQVVEKIYHQAPGAYPFFRQLQRCWNDIQAEQDVPAVRALIDVFWSYNWTDRTPAYWLFMVLGLHIATVGDPVMNKENLDRLIAQYEEYKRIGFDDPRLRNKIQKLDAPASGPELPQDKVNLDDHYGNRRAAFFFRQLSEVLSIRWEFVEYLHGRWPEIYIGSEIIENSRSCLREIENDTRNTMEIFRMYERVNEPSWLPDEAERYREFASLSRQVTKLLSAMSDQFRDLNRRLSGKNIESFRHELEAQYIKLRFYISKYQKLIQELAGASERFR